MFEFVQVHPELRFGDEYKVVCIAVAIHMLLTPEIRKSAASIASAVKVQRPGTGKLEVMRFLISLDVLVEHLHSEQL